MPFFINPVTESKYAIAPGQGDIDIIVPALQWRSKLSNITPRVAEHMLAGGTNLFTLRPQPAPLPAAKPPASTQKRKVTRKK